MSTSPWEQLPGRPITGGPPSAWSISIFLLKCDPGGPGPGEGKRVSGRAPDHLPGLRQACPTDDLGHRGQPTTVPLQNLGPRLPGLAPRGSWGSTEAWGQEACSECCRPGSQKRETLSDGPSKHQVPFLGEERPFLPSISSETHSRASTGAGQGAWTLLGVPRAKSVAVGPSSPSLPPKSITKGKRRCCGSLDLCACLPPPHVFASEPPIQCSRAGCGSRTPRMPPAPSKQDSAPSLPSTHPGTALHPTHPLPSGPHCYQDDCQSRQPGLRSGL